MMTPGMRRIFESLVTHVIAAHFEVPEAGVKQTTKLYPGGHLGIVTLDDLRIIAGEIEKEVSEKKGRGYKFLFPTLEYRHWVEVADIVVSIARVLTQQQQRVA